MRFRRSLLLVALCTLSLQACTTFIVAAKQPRDVIAESPHSVRVTLNDGRTLELGKPQLRNGYVVEVRHDSVRLSDIKQIEVPKLDKPRTVVFVALVVGLSLLLTSATPNGELGDDPSTIVPVVFIPRP
jgi:hypothetical protein